MNMRESLIRMLKQLVTDLQVLQQQGAGYYSCIPVVRRYNKLLAKARSLFPSEENLMETFDDLPENDPKDPADKMKVIQGIRIEIGQLISLLESAGAEEPHS